MPITFPRHLTLYHSLHVLGNNAVSRQIGALQQKEMQLSQKTQMRQNTHRKCAT